MQCPFCGHTETRVSDKRETDGHVSTRRRRVCAKCRRRFTTYERVELPEITVVKKDGRHEPFSREKLVLGILKAIEKRPIPSSKAEELAQDIAQGLRRKGTELVSSKHIGDLVMRRLKNLDHVAYVRFASVYRAFNTLSEFETEVERLLTRTQTRPAA